MPRSLGQPVFVFMDSLPTIYECVTSIVKYSPHYGGQAQKTAVYHFSISIYELWCMAFTEEHTASLRTIRRRIDKHLKDYRTHVQKKKGNKRANLKHWRVQNSDLFDLLKPSSDPKTFDNDENNFYSDQKNGHRRMSLSDQVDMEFENTRNIAQQREHVRNQQFQEEREYIEGGDADQDEEDIKDELDIKLQQAQSRSGLVRSTKTFVHAATQTTIQELSITPRLRTNFRNFIPKVKTTIATTSSKVGVTVEQARRAFQTIAGVFYREQYYLNASDVVCDHDVCEELEPSTPKRPRSATDYRNYEHVLPSARVVSREKHLQAIQSERNCALAMLDTEESDKITVHYDTTTRRRVKGEWTSVIVNFSSGKSFRLRPLSLALENRQNITKLLVEQLGRLSEAGETTASALWKKITALMTDSVAKNLHIEETVAATLNSKHIPIHLLCVSHTCEVFDRGNLAVLKEYEQKLGLHHLLIARMPALRSFIASSKCVVLVALEALSKLVTNDGKKSSQWELFDKELCDVGKTKKHSQFKERRFAKLGYTAATIIYHLEEYRAVLEKTKSNNQLVQACRVYLECDFVLIGLKLLAWFTYTVTFPFLNMVEKSTQTDLLQILPQLYEDLVAKKVDTLREYRVNYSFEIEEPSSAVEKHILATFCARAAANLATQRGREYGIVRVDTDPRATVLTSLNPEDLAGLPTNNLDCERDLAKFDKLAARSAACSNRKFTAKGIRDEMTVFKSESVTVEKLTRNLLSVLDQRERKWMEDQNVLTTERLQHACDTALKAEEYVHVLLHKCKSWGGPFTSVPELEKCIKRTPDGNALKNILRTEVSYRRRTSPHDFQARPNLYKLNQVLTTDLKVNLTQILTTESENIQSIPHMPTEDDMIKIFSVSENEQTIYSALAAAHGKQSTPEPEVSVNEPCIVIWDIDSIRQWYVGICLSDNGECTYTVEHLERCDPDGLRWKYPLRPDIQTVSVEQIVPCNILGSWDLTKRITTFVLDNQHTIEALFQSFY